MKRQEVLPGRFNLMAELPGPEEEPALVWICHMDTVVVGEGWTRDPFGAEEEHGLLYGRGACDMKSGLACALSAFAKTAAAVAEGRKLCRRLVFIGSVDEEDFMRGSEAAIAAGWVRRQDWVLDTEPTDGQIQVAHKGRTWFGSDSDRLYGSRQHALEGSGCYCRYGRADSGNPAGGGGSSSP